MPDDWSVPKTYDFFNVTEYAVRQAIKLKSEKGILASPEKKILEMEMEKIPKISNRGAGKTIIRYSRVNDKYLLAKPKYSVLN